MSEPIDSELRQFIGRLMTGYEQAHRRVGDLCEVLASRLERAEDIAARSLELQVRLTEEREELVSRRQQRELAAQAEAQRQARFNEVAGDVRALLPLVGKKLLGVPLSGNDSHGLQDLLSSLSPEQLDDVLNRGELKLSTSQRTLLANTLMSLGEAEKPEAAE